MPGGQRCAALQTPLSCPRLASAESTLTRSSSLAARTPRWVIMMSTEIMCVMMSARRVPLQCAARSYRTAESQSEDILVSIFYSSHKMLSEHSSLQFPALELRWSADKPLVRGHGWSLCHGPQAHRVGQGRGSSGAGWEGRAVSSIRDTAPPLPAAADLRGGYHCPRGLRAEGKQHCGWHCADQTPREGADQQGHSVCLHAPIQQRLLRCFTGES